MFKKLLVFSLFLVFTSACGGAEVPGIEFDSEHNLCGFTTKQAAANACGESLAFCYKTNCCACHLDV